MAGLSEIFPPDFSCMWSIREFEGRDGKKLYEVLTGDGKRVCVCDDYRYAVLCSFAAESIGFSRLFMNSFIESWEMQSKRIEDRFYKREGSKENVQEKSS